MELELATNSLYKLIFFTQDYKWLVTVARLFDNMGN